MKEAPIDKDKLKVLAEAAAIHAPSGDEYRSPGYDKDCWHEDVCDFANAMSPDVVLGLLAEIEHLKGLRPAGPPRPPEGEGLPRYGVRWNGPQQPVSVPMSDGYWTPWHLADQIRAEVAALTPDFEEIERLCKALAWLGVAVPSGGEEKAARWVELVSSVVRAAEGSKMLRQDAEEIQALRNDAERYRYMRKHSCEFRSRLPNHEQVLEADFDTECDAAMAKEVQP